jgi:hypothetical protein
VRRNWALTARHCLQIEAPRIVAAAGDGSTATAHVVRSLAHPTVDLALLELGWPDEPSVTAFDPIAVSGSSVKLAAGDVVTIAGYGLTETGASRELRFLAERIVATTGESITVSGFGQTGACIGDSGGPLLVRDPSGEVVVAGVMSTGSATCRDEDTYVRLDQLQDWIEERVGQVVERPIDCGSITAQGRCLYGSALWCDGGVLVSETCSGSKPCGWAPEPARFGCVEQLSDPCRGVDSVGSCRDNAALSCSGGAFERVACGSCASCSIDGKTGSPFCAAK